MPYPKYDFNKFLKAEAERAQHLQALYNFVKPYLHNQNELRQIAHIDRVRATLVQEGLSCDFNEVQAAFKAKVSNGSKIQNRIKAYLKAQKYIEQRIDQLSFNHLKKGHEILTRNTTNQKFGGILRNVSDQIDDAYELPLEHELNELIDFLIGHSGVVNEERPVIHALSIYLLFDIVQPFLVQNHAYSLIFFNAVIKREGFDLGGLLGFEKYMLRDWNTHKSIKLNSLFPLNAKERMDADLTAFFENCFTIINESYAEIEEVLIDNLKTSVVYQNMKPIERNSFNYFFERGFKKYINGIKSLNERQQSILRDVVFSRNVTTKQMVMKYRCDRKTIQRDFSELIDLGIMSSEGKTKTVNYHLSFA